MVLVVCNMCDGIENLNEWKEGDIFICVKCAKIMEKIAKIEAMLKKEFPEGLRLKLFDKMRKIIQ